MLEKEYKAYQERRSDRIRIARNFVIFWTLYWLFSVWIQFSSGLLFAIVFLIGLVGILVSYYLVAPLFWVYEFSEKMIFVNLYKALKLLELYSEEKETSNLILGKVAKYIRKATTELYNLSHSAEVNSILFQKEFFERLERLNENIRNRVLTRIMERKDIQSMSSLLRGLAKFFGEIQKPMSLNEIDNLNDALERYEEIRMKERGVKYALGTAMRSKPAKFVLSMFLGYLSTTLIFWTFCQFLPLNFIDFIQNNLVGVVSCGAVVSGLFMGIFVLKK